MSCIDKRWEVSSRFSFMRGCVFLLLECHCLWRWLFFDAYEGWYRKRIWPGEFWILVFSSVYYLVCCCGFLFLFILFA